MKPFLFKTLPPHHSQPNGSTPVSPLARRSKNGFSFTHEGPERDDFTFENFAVSTTNELAHAAAEAVAREPAKAYNPFFIYGGVGVGKPPLMQAVGRQILEDNREKQVKYLTGEEFTNEIVDAIRGKSTNEFKKSIVRSIVYF